MVPLVAIAGLCTGHGRGDPGDGTDAAEQQRPPSQPAPPPLARVRRSILVGLVPASRSQTADELPLPVDFLPLFLDDAALGRSSSQLRDFADHLREFVLRSRRNLGSHRNHLPSFVSPAWVLPSRVTPAGIDGRECPHQHAKCVEDDH